MSNPRFSSRRLFLISFSILFFEMAAIRWLNATVEILGFFNNLILISCFFGLGIGLLLARRGFELIKLAAPSLLLLVLAAVFLQEYGVHISYESDINYALQFDAEEGAHLPLSLSALVGFLVNVGFFVVLGQELGKQLDAVGEPLRAYAWDIGGSLCGVVAYAALSFLRTPPHVWYGIGLALLLVFLQHDRRWLVAGALAGVLGIGIMVTTYEGAEWSPYYKVEVQPIEDPQQGPIGATIMVDNLRIQDALDISPKLMETEAWPWIPYYQLPYHLTRPKKALILGAGSGNEIAMALGLGVEEIHAVEIDPVIASYGRFLHPNRPYLPDNVTVIVDDARHYVSHTDETYDLVLMSALDSHKQIAGMGSMRLESFVYTVGGYEQMKRVLRPGGVFCLNFISTRDWMGQRTYWSLAEAWGQEPAVYRTPSSPFRSVAFVYGPEDALAATALPNGVPIERVTDYASTRQDGVLLATDDWPHLYMQDKSLPLLYVVVLGLMLLISVVLVVAVDPGLRRPNLHFFFLGAGFMLLETRAVTQMALLFGSTWNVNSVVFGSILATILGANLLVIRGRAPGPSLAYGLLFATLLLGWLLPIDPLIGLPLVLRLLAASVAIGLPILWASILFSQSFQKETELNRAFGSNLLGTVFGGAVEYSSVLFGLDALYLVALAVYLASMMVRRRAG